jgi:transcriptional regulator with XRE-family HTH domain
MPRSAQIVSLARVIRAHREAAGLSLDELAETARLDCAYLARIERADQDPSYLDLCRLGGGLGLPGWQLMRAAELDDPRSGSYDSSSAEPGDEASV